MAASVAPLMRDARQQLVTCVESVINALHIGTWDDERVHDTRKQLKRTRAGLRLLRDALGKESYRHLNLLLRDAGREFTSIRDAKILRDALDSLLQRSDKPLPIEPLTGLYQMLQRDLNASRESLSQQTLDSIDTRLQQAAQLLHGLSADDIDGISIKAAHKRAYKKTRRAFAAAKQDASNEHLHEWRKQVKYYLQQLGFMQSDPSKRVATTIKRAHRLADLLGDDHDLALLHEKISQYMESSSSTADSASERALVKKLTHRRTRLQRKAHRLGNELFAAKSTAVAL
jgi:CHAD domain-containing protein